MFFSPQDITRSRDLEEVGNYQINTGSPRSKTASHLFSREERLTAAEVDGEVPCDPSLFATQSQTKPRVNNKQALKKQSITEDQDPRDSIGRGSLTPPSLSHPCRVPVTLGPAGSTGVTALPVKIGTVTYRGPDEPMTFAVVIALDHLMPRNL